MLFLIFCAGELIFSTFFLWMATSPRNVTNSPYIWIFPRSNTSPVLQPKVLLNVKPFLQAIKSQIVLSTLVLGDRHFLRWQKCYMSSPNSSVSFGSFYWSFLISTLRLAAVGNGSSFVVYFLSTLRGNLKFVKFCVW